MFSFCTVGVYHPLRVIRVMIFLVFKCFVAMLFETKPQCITEIRTSCTEIENDSCNVIIP